MADYSKRTSRELSDDVTPLLTALMTPHQIARQVKKPETILHMDFETFSVINIAKAGAYRHAMDASTDANCMAWAFDDEEPRLWIPGQPLPRRVREHIEIGGAIAAWNATFERLILTHVMGPKYGWPMPKIEQFYCVMTMAMAMALPGKLEKAATALGLDERKDVAGHRIMLQLCKPRKPTKNNPATRFTREEYPEKFERQDEYCLQDVRTEQAILKRIVFLSKEEQRRYWMDQHIQDRGCTVDIPLVEACLDAIHDELDRLNAELRKVTWDEDYQAPRVGSVNATKQLVDWLKETGVEWPENKRPSVDKENIEKLLARDDLSPAQRRAVEIRQEAAKTSTAKLERALLQLCEDMTIKGQLQFHGAATGRDAARGVQLQNLPRPGKGTKVLDAINDLLSGYDADLVRVFHGPVMQVIADVLRGIVVARPGYTLWTRDLSQIEARMTAWLADQDDVVEAFAAYDRKEGPDIYVIAAAGIYNCDPSEIDDAKRQVGKVAVLALGFGGGAGAFASMSKIYRVDLEPLFPTVWDLLDEDQQDRVVGAWKERGRKSGMRKLAWMAAECVKVKWRAENDRIVAYWKELEDAAIEAMLRPGETITAGRIQYRKTGSWLRCILPSGRSLFYPYPSLNKVKTPWGAKKYQISFWAQDGVTKKWKRFQLFGGLQMQNCVQAAARDIMWEAVERCEAAGYFNILRIHDEGIFECPIGEGDEDEFHELFTRPAEWAEGLPIAADGWVGPRYGKWK